MSSLECVSVAMERFMERFAEIMFGKEPPSRLHIPEDRRKRFDVMADELRDKYGVTIKRWWNNRQGPRGQGMSRTTAEYRAEWATLDYLESISRDDDPDLFKTVLFHMKQIERECVLRMAIVGISGLVGMILLGLLMPIWGRVQVQQEAIQRGYGHRDKSGVFQWKEPPFQKTGGF